ncbi:EamA family transporter RarD [Psychromarinibacter sp. S121]|uniref:EamA family transporter RarD n=1 Tax=Psychromarinibacter sp. S121 TaxID=3415127 RepID=UPI003C7B5251
MSDGTKGAIAVAVASIMWGLVPIYYKLLAHVPPLEVLAHRTIWSLVFFGLVLMVQRRLHEVRALLSRPSDLAAIAAAATLISCNWLLFIYSVQIDRVTEASLGYYIFPLVSVVLGMVFYRETLKPAQAAAVVLAAAGVGVLTWGLGAAPWISIGLALLFGFYGVIKKYVNAGPVVSVSAEVLLLVPLAVVWLWGVHAQGWTGLTGETLGTFGHDWSDSLLLIVSGPLTAVPLILFSYASRRVTMATVGLVQYLNPTLQFLVATVLFAEPFTPWHAIAFPLIWVALAIYSVWAVRHERSARRAATSSSTVSTTT